jgi:hypothetical protein
MVRSGRPLLRRELPSLRTNSTGPYGRCPSVRSCRRRRSRRPCRDDPSADLRGGLRCVSYGEGMPSSQRSTLDELRSLAEQLRVALDAVLEHADISVFRNTPGSGIVYVPMHPYTWRPLAREHQPLLGAARRLFDDWASLAERAIRHAAPSRLGAFQEHSEAMRLIVEQSDASPAPANAVVGARNLVAKDLESQLEMLADLPSAHGNGGTLLVPDTNAIIYQPALEDWMAEIGEWTAVLVPQVVRELDQLKIRDGGVAEAAQSFIRRLKEYGRRGDTFAGVQLRRGVRLRVTAIDPDMRETLEWLRAGHGDDELLASALELRWHDLNAAVVLVTRDVNLQNKARLARMPYIDVEEIAEQRQLPRKPPPRDERAEAEARARLDGSLPFMRAQLGVPPTTRATTPHEQSWTVRATPFTIGSRFAGQVLGPQAHQWFTERANEPFDESEPMPQLASPPEASARGFVVRREVGVPLEGTITLAADAGGLVGAQRRFAIRAQGRRALILRAVEDEYLHPLAQVCVDGLEHLGATGPTLIDVWIIGLGNFELLTVDHATLKGQREGWLDDAIMHMSDELILPTSTQDIRAVVARWGREIARAAGIPAWEP